MFRLASCVVLFAVAALAADDIPPPRLRVDVAALVRQLGSEDYAEREQATKRLSTLDVDEVPPELLAALKSPDAEVRDRAAKALKALREHIALNRERAAVAHLPRGERFAKLGRIDLYVASTAVTDYKADDPRLWELALDVGRAAINKADMKGDRMPSGCPALSDFATYKKAVNARFFTRSDETYTSQSRPLMGGIQAPGINVQSFLHHIVVSRGPVNTAVSQCSLVLATGDFDSEHNISASVVICDGDVQVGRNVFTSLIIARGSITIKGSTQSNTLIAGGTVTIDNPRERSRPDVEKELGDIIVEKETKPLGYITFFELSTIGVEVKVAEKAVAVAKVAEGKAFAKAGVKVGDVITEVNGKKSDSAESLRRLLRDALALGDATVTLNRGEKTETVKVSLPE